MINDYKQWYIQKEDLLNYLFELDSIIFYRIANTIKVLNYISELPEEELNDEYDLIFGVGYSFIFNLFSEIETYLQKYFHNNWHKFLEYEKVINYSLYLSDLKNVLVENGVFSDYASQVFNEILEEIDRLIVNKLKFDFQELDKWDVIIMATFPDSKENITTSEVFDRIAEELQLV